MSTEGPENVNDDSAMGGSTYDPPGRMGRQADPDLQDYLSLRLTLSHIDVPRMLEKLFNDVEMYICYKHKGSKTEKEHVHIFIPDVSFRGRLKSRLQYAGYKGNESYSLKVMHNGISNAVTYGAKEKTIPIFKGPFEETIKNAPLWKERTMDGMFDSVEETDPHKIRDFQLCYTNCVGVLCWHAKKCGRTDWSFDECFRHICDTTRWKPNIQMQQKGISPFLRSDYAVRLGKRKDRDYEFLHKWNG